MQDGFPVGIRQMILFPAGLGAGSPIGASSAQSVAHVALSAQADAKGAVYECFQFDGGFRSNLADLLQGEFSGEYGSFEANCFEELYFCCREVVCLGTGVESDGREIHFQDSKILDDQGVSSGFVHLMNHPFRLGKLVIVEDRVEGHIGLCAKQTGLGCQFFNLFDGISCCLPGTKSGRTNIDRICTVADGSNPAFQVFCR